MCSVSAKRCVWPPGVTVTWITPSARCCPPEQNQPLVDSPVPGHGRGRSRSSLPLQRSAVHPKTPAVSALVGSEAGERSLVLCGTCKSFLLSTLIYRQQQIAFFKTTSLRRSVCDFFFLLINYIQSHSPRFLLFLLQSYLLPSFFKNLVFFLFLNAAKVGLTSGKNRTACWCQTVALCQAPALRKVCAGQAKAVVLLKSRK